MKKKPKEQKPYQETRIKLEGVDPKPPVTPAPEPEIVPNPQEPEITPGDPGGPGTNPPEQPNLPEPNESEKVRREHEFKPQMDEPANDE